MTKRLYIAILMTSFCAYAQQQSPTESEYFNKRLYEIKKIDPSLGKALSDTAWNSAYMYFISYFRKPSVDRIQNMKASKDIIEDRIKLLSDLIAQKKLELKDLTTPKPRKNSSFDMLDTKDVMRLFGAILFLPFAILEEAQTLRTIQTLKDGIAKAELNRTHLELYKANLDRFLQ